MSNVAALAAHEMADGGTSREHDVSLDSTRSDLSVKTFTGFCMTIASSMLTCSLCGVLSCHPLPWGLSLPFVALALRNAFEKDRSSISKAKSAFLNTSISAILFGFGTSFLPEASEYEVLVVFAIVPQAMTFCLVAYTLMGATGAQKESDSTTSILIIAATLAVMLASGVRLLLIAGARSLLILLTGFPTTACVLGTSYMLGGSVQELLKYRQSAISQQAASDALQTMRGALSRVLAGLCDCVLHISNDGCITASSLQLTGLLTPGRPAADILGRSLAQFLPQSDFDGLLSGLVRSREGSSQPATALRANMNASDGTTIPVDIYHTHLGALEHVVAVRVRGLDDNHQGVVERVPEEEGLQSVDDQDIDASKAPVVPTVASRAPSKDPQPSYDQDADASKERRRHAAPRVPACSTSRQRARSGAVAATQTSALAYQRRGSSWLRLAFCEQQRGSSPRPEAQLAGASAPISDAISKISDTISEIDRHLDTISECMTEAPHAGGSKGSTPMSQISTTSSSISAFCQSEVPAELAVQEVGPLLGSGSFGKVYRVAMADGREAAMKVVSCRRLGDGAIEDQVREVELTSKLRHPNVVSTVAYAMTTDVPGGRPLRIFCTQEICELGTLTLAAERGWLRQERLLDLPPDMPVVWRALLDVASAMAYVHSSGVIHADLTGRNVLLSGSADSPSGFLAKVCDFGLARFPGGKSVATKVLGTITHMAPELIRLDKPELAYESDVWAFGVTAWEAHQGRRAYKGRNAAQVCVAVARRKALQWPLDAPENFVALMKECLLFEYSDRPGFAAVSGRIDSLLEAG